jgi:hypothetical protein
MSEFIDRFIPKKDADIVDHHEAVVYAPAAVVFEVARSFDLESIPIVRAIFWLRAKLLRAPHARMRNGIVEETTKLGWERLAYSPGREIVMGAVTQPWFGEVKFRPIPADSFAAFSEPDLVKIVWTLEAEPLGPERTRFATETRVLATDAGARAKFKAYWKGFGIGILMIRRLTVPAIKRQSERRSRALRIQQSPT